MANNVTLGFNPPLVPGQYFDYDLSQAGRTVPGALSNMVLIGQRTVTGSVPALTLTPLLTADQAANAFGFGSQLHLMASAALTASPYLQLSAIALDDAAGSIAASGTVTITGPATASGALSLKIANGDLITIAVNPGDSATTIAAAFAARAVQLPNLPASASAAAAVLTVTAKNKGASGNNIKLQLYGSAPGVAAAIVPMAGGATEPVITPALTAIFPVGHDLIACAYNDAANLALLRAHLDSVTGPIEQRDAVAIFGNVGSFSAVATLANGVNHGWAVPVWLRGSDSLPCEIAASFAAVAATEPDPTRPLNDLVLPGIDPPDSQQFAGATETNLAIKSGITVIKVGPGNQCQIVRAVTSRTLDKTGNPSNTLMDITAPRGLAAVRRAVRFDLAAKFPRAKGVEGLELSIEGVVYALLLKLEGKPYQWVRRVKQNKSQIVVEADPNTPGQYNTKIPANIVPGLHVLAGSIVLLTT